MLVKLPSRFKLVHINQAVTSPPEVAQYYFGVLAKLAYGITFDKVQPVVDHFATGSCEPIAQEPLEANPDAKALQAASDIATAVLDNMAQAYLHFGSKAAR